MTALVVSGAENTPLLPDAPFLDAGCTVVRIHRLADATAECARHAPQLVFLPLSVESESVLPHLRACLAQKPAPAVVIVAANDQINAAAEAMREGAFDCLFKPFSAARLARTIESALQQLPRALPPAGSDTRGTRGAAMAPRAKNALTGNGMITASPQMRPVLHKVDAVAPSRAPVFITGEVGTGKTLLARLIHDRSDRSGGPFVTLDCATLTLDRLEAEVFGPDGAATRAVGGTLVLDEVCSLDPKVQPWLLRLIETGEGKGGRGTGIGTGQADLRLVATSSQDPLAAIREGRLRADLYYRLNVAPIELPPLRAREGDIALIARTWLRQFSDAEGRGFTGFSDAALDRLTGHDWPGNVRELLNVIWTVVRTHDGPLVTPDQLPPELRQRSAAPKPAEPLPAPPPGPAVTGIDGLVGHSLAEIEQAVIEATIRAEGGSVPRAARVLDVSPSTLYRKREAWAKKRGG